MKHTRTQTRIRTQISALLVAAALIACLAAAGCGTAARDEEPDATRNAQTAADAIRSGEAAEPSESTSSNGPESAQGKTIDMQNYTVTLPEPLASNCSFSIGEESPSPGKTWVGDSVNVISDETGRAVFFVACFSNDWGPQGMLYAKLLGPASATDGANVYLCQAQVDGDQNRVPNETETYATYVTLR